MTTSLPDELLIYIFSYCTVFYSELFHYGALSFYFSTIIDNFLTTKRRAMYSGIIKYHLYSFEDSFWNGLGSHFPIWDASITPEELLVRHICKSLEHFDDDMERTDRILFYLGQRKTFLPGHDFHDQVAHYEKSLLRFVWKNISNPMLFAYFELRRAHSSWILGSKLSDWMHRYNLRRPERWVQAHFFVHFNTLSRLANRTESHFLIQRLAELRSIHEFYLSKLFTLTLKIIALAQFSVFMVACFIEDIGPRRKFLAEYSSSGFFLPIALNLLLTYCGDAHKLFLWWDGFFYKYLMNYKSVHRFNEDKVR